MAALLGRCRKLLPLNALSFFLYSAIGCLTPFLNVQARDLGLNTEESFAVNGIAGLVSVLFAILVGWTAHKCSRYKTCTIVVLVISACAYTSLLVVPRCSRSPRSPLMDFDCGEAFRMERCANWAKCSDAVASAASNFTTFSLSGCRYVCRGQKGRRPPPDAAYPLHVCFRSIDGDFCHVQDPTSHDINENGSDAVTFQSRFGLWYADDLPRLPASDFLSHKAPSNTLDLDHVPLDGDEELEEPEPDPSEFVSACKYRPVFPLVVHGKSYDDVFCRPMPSGCSIRCQVQVEGFRITPSSCQEVVGDPSLTFWSYLGARTLSDAAMLSAVALMEVAILTTIRDTDGLYGRSRISAAVGLLMFPPISGLLIDYFSSYDYRLPETHDYSPIFFLFDALVLITCALIVALPLDVSTTSTKGHYVVNSPQRRLFESASFRNNKKNHQFWSCEMFALVFLLLILGSYWGFLECFLPSHYVSQDINSNQLQFGLTWMLSFICTIPFLVVSKDLVRNIGRAHLLVFGFLFYGIRFAGLSFVTDPYWTFPFEAMEALSLSVVWIAAVSYGHFLLEIPIPGGSAFDISRGSHFRLRLHYLLLLTHFGLGRALGSLYGFYLLDSFGLAWTFRGIALFSGSIGLCYLLVYHTCMRTCRKDAKQRRKNVNNTQSTMNGGWWPMTNQSPEQRPNGDAQQMLQDHRQPASQDHRQDLQEQPILMIDEGLDES